MDCYQDSEDTDLLINQVENNNYSNQIMLTEGFPITDAHGARANSLVELKFKRESFDHDQNIN